MRSASADKHVIVPDRDHIEVTYNVECLFCSASFNKVEAAHEYNAIIRGRYSQAEKYDGPEDSGAVSLCARRQPARGLLPWLRLDQVVPVKGVLLEPARAREPCLQPRFEAGGVEEPTHIP